jgi:hypothetical protein
MRNCQVGVHEAKDIQDQVEKLLKGLGNPEPPLDLREVRELLKLDLTYYSSSDDGVLQEFISKLKIAGKQILKRPTLIGDVIRKAKLSGLWLPDRKRILIDENIPKLKHRWCETHEISHGIIPWHKSYLFGDSKDTLNPACYEQLECEANYASGKLLFLMDRFAEEARDHPLDIKSVHSLAKGYGNTKTSTLWRFIEEAHQDQPLLGVISEHPHRLSSDFDHLNPCKYFIRSPRFEKEFDNTTEAEVFEIIGSYCRYSRGGPLGESEAVLNDINGDKHLFRFMSFSNTHDVLTLAVYQGKKNKLVSLAV